MTRRARWLLGAGLVAFGAAQAQAQAAPPTTPDSSEGTSAADIIVTAQKREQSVQDVPIAISVLTAQDLVRNRIESFADYAVRVPNVAFTNLGDRSQTRIAIRGVGPISTGGTANLVGVFIDEFNVAPNISTRTSDPSLFDASRIEVLKGPQGTFFGRNVVAGAISITTVKPEPGADPTGDVRLTYSSFDTVEARGGVSVPLGEMAAARAVGYYDRSDGYLGNTGPFGIGNATENYGGRLSLRLQPQDGLTIDLSGQISKQTSELPSFVPTGFASASLGLLNGFRALVPGTPRFPVTENGTFPANEDRMSTDIGLPTSNRTGILVGRFEAELSDAVTLTNVTGYIDNKYRAEGEGDYTRFPSFTVRRDEDMTSLSTETRLTGEVGALNWLVGFHAANDTFSTYQNSIHLASDPFLPVYNIAFSVLGGTVCPPAITGLPTNIPGPCPGFSRFIPGVNTSAGFFENFTLQFKTRNIAAFGNLSLKLGERVTVDVGGRYSDDRITGSLTTGPLIAGLAPRPSFPNSRITFDDFSPRAAITFEPSDALTLYALASRGYRVGGFNTTPGDAPFGKESLWNYEGGVKLGTRDGKFRASLSVFYMDWNNTQVRAQDVITQRQVILNAEGSKHRGFELEARARPADWFEAGIAYGYVKATFKNFANARDLDGNRLDATGQQVPLSPRNSISADAQASIPLTDDIRGTLRAEYSFKDDTKEDVSLNTRRLNPAYELVNLRLGIEGRRVTVTGFVENLFDVAYRYGTSNLETFLSGAQASVGPGRRFGVSVGGRF